MRRIRKLMGVGSALLLALAPAGGALADNLDNLDGDQLNDTLVTAAENALVGSGSQSTLVGGAANTGSGTQTDDNSVSSLWHEMINANAGSGTQIDNSPNSNGGNRDSADVLIDLGSGAAVTNSDLGATVTGNQIDVSGGMAESDLSMTGEESGFSGLYGVNAVAASAGAQSSQNVSVDVGAEVMTY